MRVERSISIDARPAHHVFTRTVSQFSVGYVIPTLATPIRRLMDTGDPSFSCIRSDASSDQSPARFMGVCFCLALTAASQWALASERHYSHQGADGVMVFSDAPLVDGQFTRQSYGLTKRSAVAANPCKGLTNRQLDAKATSLHEQFVAAGEQHSVDVSLLKAVARAESCFDPKAVSSAGAQGMMQLMPETAAYLGVSNSFDAIQNINGGAQYLSDMLDRYSGDVSLALAAYNAGPGNVDRYKGVPPFEETKRYVDSVLQFRLRYQTTS